MAAAGSAILVPEKSSYWVLGAGEALGNDDGPCLESGCQELVVQQCGCRPGASKPANESKRRARIYPLTDLSPRKAEAVSRRYLDGRYGATPIISDAEFDVLAVKVATGSPG